MGNYKNLHLGVTQLGTLLLSRGGVERDLAQFWGFWADSVKFCSFLPLQEGQFFARLRRAFPLTIHAKSQIFLAPSARFSPILLLEIQLKTDFFVRLRRMMYGRMPAAGAEKLGVLTAFSLEKYMQNSIFSAAEGGQKPETTKSPKSRISARSEIS